MQAHTTQELAFAQSAAVAQALAEHGPVLLLAAKDACDSLNAAAKIVRGSGHPHTADVIAEHHHRLHAIVQQVVDFSERPTATQGAQMVLPLRASVIGAVPVVRPSMPTTYRSDLGRERVFLSRNDMLAYETGYRMFPAPIQDVYGTPLSMGWADRRDEVAR